MVDHIAEAAGDREIEPLLASLAEHYLASMRVVDVSNIAIPGTEGRLAAVKDRDDEPSARLSRLVDPSLLLTRDRDLTDQDFGVWYEPSNIPSDWVAAAFTLYDRSFDTQVTAGAEAAALTVAVPAIGAAESARVALRHPRLAAGTALVGGVALYLSRRSPRWAAARSQLADAFTAMMTEASLHATPKRFQDSQTAKRQLAEYRHGHAGPGTRESILARHLAIAPAQGLTARDLHDIIGRRFAVRSVLEGSQAFVSGADGRWHLGVPAQLPPGVGPHR